MPPVNRVAENVLGTIGTIFWTIQIIPQIWKSYKTKSTEGLSPALVVIWGLSGGPLGTYVIAQNLNIPLILQPELFAALCFVSWGQCLHYQLKKPKRTVFLLVLGLMVFVGVFEFLMVIALRLSYRPSLSPFDSTPLGTDKPGVLFFGILAACMIALGLVPQYYEIYIYKEVKGISKIFMVVDMLGGIFSILSLTFKEEFDVTASVVYASVVVLDGIVLLLALILNPRARRRGDREGGEDAINSADTVEVKAEPEKKQASTSEPP